MAYTHGTQWNDELIKEKILEVVKNTDLERMPSRSEIRSYFNNDKLTNAIRRRKGYYAYASELGLPIKDSDTYFGKTQEVLASEELIAKGFEVRRMPQNFPYDLLVNDCVKIDVKAARLYHGPGGSFYSYNLGKPFCTCDIYLLYLINNDGSTKDVLVIPSKFVATQTQVGIGETSSKYYKYSQRWDYIESYSEFLEGVS